MATLLKHSLINTNSFRSVGYYEFSADVFGNNMYFNYWSKFARSTKVLPIEFQTSVSGLEVILVGLRLFAPKMSFLDEDNLQKKSFRESELKKYLISLKHNNFGVMDNLFNLFPRLKTGAQGSDVVTFFSSITTETIVNHLFDLQIKSVKSIDFDRNVIIVGVGSNEFDGETIDLAMTSESIPQSATDVIPIFVPKSGINVMVNERTGERKINTKNIYTTIGYKAKQAELNIGFLNNVTGLIEHVNVLTVGLYGAIPGSGEHLVPEEKAEIATAIAKKKPTDSVVKLNKRSTTFALRAIAEEIGLELRDTSVVFICGEHDKVGRDQRYHTFNDKNGFEFGYPRYSKSYISVVVNVVDDLPNEYTKYSPEDTEEISSSRAISLHNIITNFRVGGVFEPAIPSHTEIINDVVTQKVLACVRETSLELFGNDTLISEQSISEVEWKSLSTEFVHIY